MARTWGFLQTRSGSGSSLAQSIHLNHEQHNAKVASDLFSIHPKPTNIITISLPITSGEDHFSLASGGTPPALRNAEVAAGVLDDACLFEERSCMHVPTLAPRTEGHDSGFGSGGCGCGEQFASELPLLHKMNL